MDFAYRLADNAVTRQFDSLSTATVDATNDGLIDSLACALAGVRAHGLDQARTALGRWGQDGCTVWGGFGKAPAPVAAFLNAVALHALDYDDTDDKVPLHAFGMVLPGLLADLEENLPDCDGQRFLTALAVGVDGAMRVGRAGGPKGSRGWNYSVISGSIGAVLAIANLRGWDAQMTVDALGHQLTQTSGSLQSIIDGSLAKRFQPAQLVKNVMFSVALAQSGIDGPRNVFEGKAGFINLYQDGKFDLEAAGLNMHHCNLIEDLSLKPYPACRFTHAPIDLALELHRNEGLRLDDIKHIDIRVSGQAVNMVGRQYDPRTAGIVDAQFSIAYTVAVGLAKGAVLIGDFTDEAIRDEKIGRFAHSQITITADDALPFLGMTPVFFDVTLNDGRVMQVQTDVVSGSPQKRMSAAQLRDKVDDCLNYGESDTRTDALVNAVESLRTGMPVKTLLALLS
ncbi:MmgE/PrpD family protein [Advenella mimigardefordensis]|uniref:Putative 2-methylcitrate dehydratase PrpD n=1 Tax=Advenella mimigardefordensis (strain DSM 17166 / LMG 22922 / DPN7) TaxID=1247726 RepID=W0PBI4_ADVMD|nr:MmgE/PrpD family protein [Advenella mimigardefordensis]AHG64101.1 putative 2-methylcitrate dehydratase PrpD [Advenella mimigardefordensis DPN7]